MKRSIKPHVVLPRLDADDARLLGLSLAAAIDHEERLPAHLDTPVTTVRRTLEDLEACVRRRLHARRVEPGRPRTVREAQLAESAAWSALHTLVSAWSRLPAEAGGAEGESAAVIGRAVFSEGLTFLHLRTNARWVATDVRLALIRPGLTEHLRRIGGDRFFDYLQRSHRAVGDILGVTRALRYADEPSLKACLTAFLDAVRSYVLHVALRVEDGDDGEALAHRLLAPIERWREESLRRSRRSRRLAATALRAADPIEESEPSALPDPVHDAPPEAPVLPLVERAELRGAKSLADPLSAASGEPPPHPNPLRIPREEAPLTREAVDDAGDRILRRHDARAGDREGWS